MKKLFISFIAVLIITGAYLYISIFNTGNDNISIREVNRMPAETAGIQSIQSVQNEGLFPDGYINAFVVKVVDGDTIKVEYKRKSYSVRLLDIDTPESVKDGVAVQGYAKEASRFTREIVLNKQVRLVFGKGLRDKYGRLLAYVFLEDGEFINALLVIKGYARVEIIPPNIANDDYFYQLQGKAIEEKAGLWGLPADKQPFIKDDDGEYLPKYWLDENAS